MPGATIVLRRSGGTTSASSEDLAAVRDFAVHHDLEIDRESGPERSVRVSGTAQQMRQAFGPSTIPAALQGIAIAVLGLDERPIAKPHSE